MEATHCQRRPLLCLGAVSVLIASAGCSRPDFVFSVNSAADAANQRFEESLVGTWAAYTNDEAYVLVTVARAAEDSRDYVVRMNDPDNPDGLEDQWSGRMRLLRIGEFEFIEL